MSYMFIACDSIFDAIFVCIKELVKPVYVTVQLHMRYTTILGTIT